MTACRSASACPDDMLLCTMHIFLRFGKCSSVIWTDVFFTWACIRDRGNVRIGEVQGYMLLMGSLSLMVGGGGYLWGWDGQWCTGCSSLNDYPSSQLPASAVINVPEPLPSSSVASAIDSSLPFSFSRMSCFRPPSTSSSSHPLITCPRACCPFASNFSRQTSLSAPDASDQPLST